MDVSKIDILVYPAYSDQEMSLPSGVIPSTGVYVTHQRHASLARERMWFNYASEITNDSSRLQFIASQCFGLRHAYLWDTESFLGKKLEIARWSLKNIGERCFFFDDVEIFDSSSEKSDNDVLKQRVAERGFKISDPVDNSVYGQHRGACTLKIGQKVLDSLGLKKTVLHENKRASTTRQEGLIYQIAERDRPDLYAILNAKEASGIPEIDQLPPILKEKYLNNIFSHIFLTNTPLQFRHRLQECDTIQDFIRLFTPEFAPEEVDELVRTNIDYTWEMVKNNS